MWKDRLRALRLYLTLLSIEILESTQSSHLRPTCSKIYKKNIYSYDALLKVSNLYHGSILPQVVFNKRFSQSFKITGWKIVEIHELRTRFFQKTDFQESEPTVLVRRLVEWSNWFFPIRKTENVGGIAKNLKNFSLLCFSTAKKSL